MNGWLLHGGGMALWEELYARYNLVPLVGGNTGVQMAGWFNKEINTLDDLKGVKMRIPGWGARSLMRQVARRSIYRLARFSRACRRVLLTRRNGWARSTT